MVNRISLQQINQYQIDLQTNVGSKLKCLNACRKNFKCYIVYHDLNQKNCFFYKYFQLDNYNATLNSSSNTYIYRKKSNRIEFGSSISTGIYFSIKRSTNDLNSLSEIKFICETSIYGNLTRAFQFTYSDNQTFYFGGSGSIRNVSIDLRNKKITGIYYYFGEYIDYIRFCLKDIYTSQIKCDDSTSGCNKFSYFKQKLNTEFSEIFEFFGQFSSQKVFLSKFGFNYLV